MELRRYEDKGRIYYAEAFNRELKACVVAFGQEGRDGCAIIRQPSEVLSSWPADMQIFLLRELSCLRERTGT